MSGTDGGTISYRICPEHPARKLMGKRIKVCSIGKHSGGVPIYLPGYVIKATARKLSEIRAFI